MACRLQGRARARLLEVWAGSAPQRSLCDGPTLRRDRPPYNGLALSYNAGVTAVEHLMTVSQNGQVSIPAEARARWRTRKVIVVDLGDRVVMRPAPDDDGVAGLQGKYADRGPDSTSARRAARGADETAARRRRA